MTRTLELEAQTPEDAIARALTVLKASRAQVEVEILDPGRKGVVGMGARLARVRVTMREPEPMVEEGSARAPTAEAEEEAIATELEAEVSEPRAIPRAQGDTMQNVPEGHEPEAMPTEEEEEEQPQAEPESAAPARRSPRRRRRLDGKDAVVRRPRRPHRVESEGAESSAPAPVEAVPTRSAGRGRVERREQSTEPPPPRTRAPREAPPVEEAPEESAAAALTPGDFAADPEAVVTELLDLIGCGGEVEAYGDSDAFHVDVEADDTSLLIGKHGQNLESLQHVVWRICNRGRSEPKPVVIDVGDYRKRRIETLEDMAFNLADKVARTGRPMSLQPMPAQERRIVHLVLRDDPDVETYSRGRGDRRYVVLAPKRRRNRRGRGPARGRR